MREPASRPVEVIVFYISGHGFGHASREIEVMGALRDRRPNLRIVVRSGVPAWLFDSAARVPFELQACETDTGVVQVDSLRVDEEETARRAARFYAEFDVAVARESAVLAGLGASLVVSDVPPLASAAARQAGLPSVVIANFTWDWIYPAYPQFDRLAPHVLPTIRSAYSTTTLALRLPMHGGFETMPAVTDIAMIARRAGRPREETRRLLGLDADEPVVLASFGGYGLKLPYGDIARRNHLTILVSGNGAGADASDRRLKALGNAQLTALGLRYTDLVAAADVVVTKPGYGIVSECTANEVALLYTSRGRFAEYDVMVGEMPRFLRCRHIAQDDLVNGRWRKAVESLLAQPPPRQRAATGGADVAADAILGVAGWGPV